jgi:hypothetical protein
MNTEKLRSSINEQISPPSSINKTEEINIDDNKVKY